MDSNKDLSLPALSETSRSWEEQQRAWEEHKKQNEQVKQDRFRQLGAITLLYAVLYTFFIYDNFAGITMPLWIITTIVYCCQVFKRFHIAQKKTGIFHMIIMVLLGISTCLTGNPYIILMNYMGFFLLLLSFLLHTIHDDKDWGIGTFFVTIILTIFGAIEKLTVPFQDLSAFRTLHSKEESKNSLYIILGLITAIPCCIFVGSLLGSADAVFQRYITKTLSCFILPSNWFGVLALFVFAFFSAYCGICELLKRVHIEHTAIQVTQKIKAMAAISFMSPITLIYVIFSAVQIFYLFLGFGTLPAGITYADYARTGFFQLLFLCTLNFIVVLFVQNCVEENKLLRGILLAICVSTLIMIASSAYRMLLYIGAYKLTFLRIFVLLALLIIAFLMTGVLLSLFKKKFQIYQYSLIIVSILYVGFSFSHVDYFIASYNLSHMEETADANSLDYISTLSSDAAPAIADYLEHNQELQRKVTSVYNAKSLWEDENIYDMDPDTSWYLCYRQRLDHFTLDTSLRKFNVSYHIAKNKFK